MLKKWSGLLALMLFASTAMAATGRSDVRSQVEASMMVNGTLDIDAQGQVTEYQLAEQASLPPALLAVVDRHVRAWRFEPVQVDGSAVRARSPMHVRLVMKRDGDRYLFRIAGATFGSTYEAGAAPTVNGTLSPPRYPAYAYTSNVGGVVYLVVKVGRDGSVEDTIAEQVNLRSLGSEGEMARFREILADPAISVSKKWKFNFPTRGEDADKPYVLVRVAVEYLARDMPSERAGRWLPYVPGPRQPVPWRNWDAAAQQPDAINVGEAYPDNPKGPKLIGSIDG